MMTNILLSLQAFLEEQNALTYRNVAIMNTYRQTQDVKTSVGKYDLVIWVIN